MRDLSRLIEKIEGLDGPSRKADGAIGRCLAGGVKDHWYDHLGSWVSDDTIPAYTASLDAATALVERVLPGWSWECRRSGTGDKGQATVWNPRKAPGYNDEQRAFNCPSPAIAICLAALRALQQEDRR